MRAVVITQPGGPEVLDIQDVPVGTPTGDELLVRVQAFGINRADVLQRRGLYPAPRGVPQDIPGLEIAGVVEVAGPGVQGFAPGDRIMGIVGGGAYAEYALVSAAHVTPVPDGLSFADSAAIPEVFVTAHDALERLGVMADEWVLVHAIGSGVGTAALQLITARGARCIGTSRTRAKLELAEGLGMEIGIDTTVDELAPTVQRVTGAGADAAVDLIGGSMFANTLDALSLRGRVILVGLTAGSRADVDLGLVLRKRLRIEGTVLRSRSYEEKAAVMQSFAEKVLPLFQRQRVKMIVDRVFSFDQIRDAHAYMESNASFGKIVVEFQ